MILKKVCVSLSIKNNLGPWSLHLHTDSKLRPWCKQSLTLCFAQSQVWPILPLPDDFHLATQKLEMSSLPKKCNSQRIACRGKGEPFPLYFSYCVREFLLFRTKSYIQDASGCLPTKQCRKRGRKKQLWLSPLPFLVKLWADGFCQLILFWYGSSVILTGGLKQNWIIFE